MAVLGIKNCSVSEKSAYYEMLYEVSKYEVERNEMSRALYSILGEIRNLVR